jgi:hypothetical protein
MSPSSIDRQLSKSRVRFDDAAQVMAAAVATAALRAATVAVMDETGTTAEQVTRSAIRHEGIVRRIFDSSGKLAGSVLSTSLGDPWLANAWEAGVYRVAQLLCTAWRARVGGDR